MYTWPVRIYYEDTDAGGIVYYANYLKFIERARTEWLRSLGVEQCQLLDEGVGFVVRKVDLNLLTPARFNDELEVSCTVEKLRNASVLFQQQVRRKNGDLLCEAHVLAACVNLNAMQPVAIPRSIIEVIRSAI